MRQHRKGTKVYNQAVEQAAMRFRGQLKFLGGLGVSAFRSFFDPRAIALYGKEGISPSAQKLVNRALDAYERGDNKAGEKAMGQFIYSGNHIPAQAGRQGGENPVLQALRDAAFLGDENIPFTRENFVEQVGRLSTTETLNNKARKITTTTKELECLRLYAPNMGRSWDTAG